MLIYYWPAADRPAAVDFALWAAAAYNRPALLQQMVAAGGNAAVAIDGVTPAMAAANGKHLAIIKALAAGAKEGGGEGEGKGTGKKARPPVDPTALSTPLHVALRGANVDLALVKYFVEEEGYGPEHDGPITAFLERNPSPYNRAQADTCLWLASSNLPVLRYLVSKGWDPKTARGYEDKRTKPNPSLLYKAARRGDLEMMKYLVEECGIGYADDEEGVSGCRQTSLAAAASCGYSSSSEGMAAYKYLESKGWDWRVGRSPIFEAVESSNEDLCEYLIETVGVPYKSRDPLGGSCLSYLRGVDPWGSLYSRFKENDWSPAKPRPPLRPTEEAAKKPAPKKPAAKPAAKKAAPKPAAKKPAAKKAAAKKATAKK